MRDVIRAHATTPRDASDDGRLRNLLDMLLSSQDQFTEEEIVDEVVMFYLVRHFAPRPQPTCAGGPRIVNKQSNTDTVRAGAATRHCGAHAR